MCTIHFFFLNLTRPSGNVKKTHAISHSICILSVDRGAGGAVAQSVERATPGEEVSGLISAMAVRSLLFGLVSV